MYIQASQLIQDESTAGASERMDVTIEALVVTKMADTVSALNCIKRNLPSDGSQGASDAIARPAIFGSPVAVVGNNDPVVRGNLTLNSQESICGSQVVTRIGRVENDSNGLTTLV